MSVKGSLSTLRVTELLQMAALSRKRGSVRLSFPNGRVISVFLQDGFLSGVSDTGRVWQLGELLRSLGRVGEDRRKELIEACRAQDKRLGQVLVEQEVVSRDEMEILLRRLILQSLLFAVESEESGTFELKLGTVSETTVMFPLTDLLIEISAAMDQLRRLRGVLGEGVGPVALRPDTELTGRIGAVSYRRAQVLAQVDGEKTPVEIAFAAPFGLTENLELLAELGELGILVWGQDGEGDGHAPVFALTRTGPRAVPGPEIRPGAG